MAKQTQRKKRERERERERKKERERERETCRMFGKPKIASSSLFVRQDAVWLTV